MELPYRCQTVLRVMKKWWQRKIGKVWRARVQVVSAGLLTHVKGRKEQSPEHPNAKGSLPSAGGCDSWDGRGGNGPAGAHSALLPWQRGGCLSSYYKISGRNLRATNKRKPWVPGGPQILPRRCFHGHVELARDGHHGPGRAHLLILLWALAETLTPLGSRPKPSQDSVRKPSLDARSVRPHLVAVVESEIGGLTPFPPGLAAPWGQSCVPAGGPEPSVTEVGRAHGH